MSSDKQTDVKQNGLSETGLPLEVKYCKKCTESNQRFIGSVPHEDKTTSIKDTIIFGEDGVCSACKYYEFKETINWKEREKLFLDILDRHKRKDGYYDVLVPGSGGKDSRYTSHILKYKYGMNPLTITWAPHMYTDIGWKNLQTWIQDGFDHILFTPNAKTHSILTRLAFENLLHPFQPFIFGQINLAPTIAMEKNIKLIFYGDYGPERGVGTDVDLEDKEMDIRFCTYTEEQELYFGGVHIDELPKYGITRKDLHPYIPFNANRFVESGIEQYYIPYFLNYDPQNAYYFAAEHTGFEVNPDGRTEGTYSKYQSLDDKVDGFHYYTWFIKTGRGRATEDTSIEIRNKHITREEGVALVKRFDGEFPQKYFSDFLKYLDISEERFWEIINDYRPSHIWQKQGNEWKLKTQVS